MEFLDGWAISIGDSTCRYLSSHGHEGLRGLICSDGSYSAGWRVVVVAVFLAIVTYVVYRTVRIGP